jgi:hypothetical protein
MTMGNKKKKTVMVLKDPNFAFPWSKNVRTGWIKFQNRSMRTAIP